MGPKSRMGAETAATVVPDRVTASAETSHVRSACYGLVWLTFAVSGLVLVEPAPVDALSLGLFLLLPMVGLVRITPALLSYLCLWLIVTAAQLVSATQAPELAPALLHTTISFQLIVVSFVAAAFIARSPSRHVRIVLGGWLVAAVIASVAAIAGYFALLPGAEDIFTRYARGTGTFKDPNVFAPFLIVPLLYVLHLALTRPLRSALPALVAGVLLAIGLLLSFSRGAWFCLAVAVLVWGGITFVIANRMEQRKLINICVFGGAAVALLLVAALQLDEVSRLLEVRATLSQDYDHGPDGRFGGQIKALALIAENPLGIGSLTFSPLHHHEEAHNVYLTMALNAGWLGGGLYLMIVVLTFAVGSAGLMHSSAARPFLAIALAGFIATALEGAIIDSDHWRHFYLEMAMVWGLTAGTREVRRASTLSL